MEDSEIQVIAFSASDFEHTNRVCITYLETEDSRYLIITEDEPTSVLSSLTRVAALIPDGKNIFEEWVDIVCKFDLEVVVARLQEVIPVGVKHDEYRRIVTLTVREYRDFMDESTQGMREVIKDFAKCMNKPEYCSKME